MLLNGAAYEVVSRPRFMLIRDAARADSKIHEAAKLNNRTFNAEIVARLHCSFDTRDTDIAQDTVGAVLKTLSTAISHAEHLAKRLEIIEKKRS